MATGHAPSAVARYYDGLTRYVGLASRLGLGSAEPLTMHRRLRDAAGAASGGRLHDILFAEIGPPAGRNLLDAGCGVGGTLIAWAEQGGRGRGITLSPVQCARAAAAIARRGLAARCRVHCASYDSDLHALLDGDRFDAVIAIESLVHSRDPAATLANLAAMVAPGGRLAVVDDMPAADLAPDDGDLSAFQRYWHAPGAMPAAALRAAIEASGLRVAADRDLTAEIERRPPARTRRLARLNRVVRRLVPSAPAGRVLDAHYGGLVLERLYARGVMEYRLIVAAASA
ncbi:MAG: methyltransferase domain-containing protein [Alphaproteobacteria bacterium]|nr:methyltransferase domain-containing protein [Alphaproteobacteria bacterium]